MELLRRQPQIQNQIKKGLLPAYHTAIKSGLPSDPQRPQSASPRQLHVPARLPPPGG